MTYPLSILTYVMPYTGISISTFLDISNMLIRSDSVQVDDGYDEEKDDLVWDDVTNKQQPAKYFLDLIFTADEIYDL